MTDDNVLFDNDDIIIFTKKEIILEKLQYELTVQQNKKFKDLDGNWKINLLKKEDESDLNSLWITKYENDVYKIYLDIKEKLAYSNILSKITFSNLSEYINYCHEQKRLVLDLEWNDYEEYKMYGLKNPSIEEWTSHHLIELHDLYVHYYIFSELSFGTSNDFINFCYKYSDVKNISKY